MVPNVLSMPAKMGVKLMDFREIAKDIFNNFFVIFACSVIWWYVYLRFFGIEVASLSDITALFITAVLTSFANIIFYSKREPTRLEMFIRHVIHMIIVAAIIMAVASYIGWVLWSVPITVVRFAGLIVMVYITIYAILYHQSKKVADTLNEKLKERYGHRS